MAYRNVVIICRRLLNEFYLCLIAEVSEILCLKTLVLLGPAREGTGSKESQISLTDRHPKKCS